jgi:hypothetical protein
LRVVDVENSDSILRGSIVQAEDVPYSYSKDEVVGEYRFTVAIDIEWIDVSNDKILLDKRHPTLCTFYPIKSYH